MKSITVILAPLMLTTAFNAFADDKVYCSGIGIAYDGDKLYHSKVFDYEAPAHRDSATESSIDSQWQRYVSKKASSVPPNQKYVQIHCRAYKDEKRDAREDAEDALNDARSRFDSAIKLRGFSPRV
ncbi:hypothetical protein [Pseudoalteromonas pernae]|uniref:hypothetical protein n=1 Tax=Pseudoalteromonas pernae TaxID=3118054 RepID=UPI0032428996